MVVLHGAQVLRFDLLVDVRISPMKAPKSNLGLFLMKVMMMIVMMMFFDASI